MKILLTGSNGFIGNHIKNYFKNKHEIYAPSRKELDLSKEINTDFIPDVIIHSAGNAITRYSKDNVDKYISDNIIATKNLLEKFNNCKFIFLSTILVYENKMYADEFYRLSGHNLYATSKICCENMIMNYSKIKNITPVILRLGATVGTGLTHGFLMDLLKKIKESETNVELIGNCPGSLKPYTHIDDVCSKLDFIINNKISDIYNICVNDNASILHIAEEVMKLLNIKRNINWTGSSWVGDDNIIKISNYKSVRIR